MRTVAAAVACSVAAPRAGKRSMALRPTAAGQRHIQPLIELAIAAAEMP